MNAGHRLCGAVAAGLLVMLAAPSSAQQPVLTTAAAAPAPYAAGTGDAWIDARLKDLNDYAPRYPDAFVDEVARYLDVPRGYVVALGQQPGWAPGDVYFACALGKVLAQPCRVVVRARARSPGEDWKDIAAQVAPAGTSVPTRTLRELLRNSYAHWDRPLD